MIVFVQNKGKALIFDVFKKTITIKTKKEEMTFQFDDEKLRLFLKICGGFYEGLGGNPDGEAN